MDVSEFPYEQNSHRRCICLWKHNLFGRFKAVNSRDSQNKTSVEVPSCADKLIDRLGKMEKSTSQSNKRIAMHLSIFRVKWTTRMTCGLIFLSFHPEKSRCWMFLIHSAVKYSRDSLWGNFPTTNYYFILKNQKNYSMRATQDQKQWWEEYRAKNKGKERNSLSVNDEAHTN